MYHTDITMSSSFKTNTYAFLPVIIQYEVIITPGLEIAKQSDSNVFCMNYLLSVLMHICGLSEPAHQKTLSSRTLILKHTQIGNNCNLIH